MPLHLAGESVTLDELRDLPVPDGSASWRPVLHHHLVPVMRRFIRDQDAEVDAEEFRVSRSGALSMLVVTGRRRSDRYRPAVAMRCSTDRSASMLCAVGAVLGNSDNLLLRVFILQRKATMFALEQISRWLEVTERQRYYYRESVLGPELAMRCTHVTDELFSAVLGIAMGSGLMIPKQMQAAWRLWHEAPEDDMRQRTAFAAVNCCSAALKTTQPKDALDRYVGLYGLWTEHREAFGRRLVDWRRPDGEE